VPAKGIERQFPKGKKLLGALLGFPHLCEIIMIVRRGGRRSITINWLSATV
jgi:hypothetical protein